MFTHLHLHTDASLLDGTIRLPQLVARLKELEMKACALTDHGNMYNSYKFYAAMKAEGLKPIIGCEIYVAPRSMHQKESGIDNKYFHLVLLAQNLIGYKNLMKIVSLGHMEGFYYKPRVDVETLEKYSDGLIASSACLGGVISRHLLNNNPVLAKETAKKYSEIYPDRFYIEIQRNGIDEAPKVNEELLKIAKELNLPILATCDAHYLLGNKKEKKETEIDDSEIQEILWCIADGKTLDDKTRRTLGSDEFYVKSTQEMEELFKDLPEAIENTQKIADSIEDYDITFEKVEPKFLFLPEGKTQEQYLRELTYEGAKERYGEISEELKQRLDYELSVIHEKGYDDYFLVERYFVLYCRDNGIVVGMRGSGCGSAVAYCVGITNIEPIGWELYFERFLNPERKSFPDFDLDIADARRQELLEFVIKTYGLENVKQIGTFSKLQTRQAIRDVCRVLGVDLSIADRLSKMVVIAFGKSKSMDYMLENDKEFEKIIKSDPKLMKMSDIVTKISGMYRGISTHACGMVITPTNVTDYVPIQKDAHGQGIGITQYEMTDLEYVGVMKFDFLGLRNLNVIGETVKKLRDTRDADFDLFKIDQKDPKAFQLLQSGYTVGIFQLESEGMRKTIRGLKPVSQEEICYLLAAYRPGPLQFIPEYIAVKNGDKKPDYFIDALEPILSITNGVITYQEQVIRIAVDIAGYTMGSADAFRKAMGKKKMDVIEKEKPVFFEGAIKRGFSEEKLISLWDRLIQFANYGFNKAHSASYAIITYWTAYLKANYTLEFMASLLQGDLDNFDRVVLDLEECARLGIKVFPPTINKSQLYFAIEDEKNIRFGLGAIKNVGEEAVRTVIGERESNGPYLNFDDFVFRSVCAKLQLKALEYLIKAGVLDEFGDRNGMITLLPTLFERYRKEHEISKQGQIDLFGGEGEKAKTNITTPTPIQTDNPTSSNQKLDWEKELLGIYLSSHPLDELLELFKSKNAIPIRELADRRSDELVVIGALVSKVRRISTKKGDSMAFLSVEDKTGTTDLVVFPKTFEELKDILEANVPMLFAGKINIRNNERSIIVEKAMRIDREKHKNENVIARNGGSASVGVAKEVEPLEDSFDGITFKIGPQHKEEEIKELKDFIRSNPGDKTVRVMIDDGDNVKVTILKQKIVSSKLTNILLERFS